MGPVSAGARSVTFSFRVGGRSDEMARRGRRVASSADDLMRRHRARWTCDVGRAHRRGSAGPSGRATSPRGRRSCSRGRLDLAPDARASARSKSALSQTETPCSADRSSRVSALMKAPPPVASTDRRPARRAGGRMTRRSLIAEDRPRPAAAKISEMVFRAAAFSISASASTKARLQTARRDACRPRSLPAPIRPTSTIARPPSRSTRPGRGPRRLVVPCRVLLHPLPAASDADADGRAAAHARLSSERRHGSCCARRRPPCRNSEELSRPTPFPLALPKLAHRRRSRASCWSWSSSPSRLRRRVRARHLHRTETPRDHHPRSDRPAAEGMTMARAETASGLLRHRELPRDDERRARRGAEHAFSYRRDIEDYAGFLARRGSRLCARPARPSSTPIWPRSRRAASRRPPRRAACRPSASSTASCFRRGIRADDPAGIVEGPEAEAGAAEDHVGERGRPAARRGGGGGRPAPRRRPQRSAPPASPRCWKRSMHPGSASPNSSRCAASAARPDLAQVAHGARQGQQGAHGAADGRARAPRSPASWRSAARPRATSRPAPGYSRRSRKAAR